MNFFKSTNFVGIGFLLLFVIIQLTRADFYTSLDGMEELLETEAVLISNLKRYIDVLEMKIDNLKDKVDEYELEHAESEEDVSAYLSNPINAYLLTKRLTSDWKQIENFMSLDVGNEIVKNITNYRNVLKFPSDEDLNGAAAALIRLQDTYKLDTSSVASGELNGIQYSSEMSSNDCFELGRQLFLNGDYDYSVSWMSEALHRLSSEKNNTLDLNVWKAEILEHLAFATYVQGNIKSALALTNELLDLVPNHENAANNIKSYQKLIMEGKDKGIDEVKTPDTKIKLHSNPLVFDLVQRKVYEMICRGELKPSPEQLRPLRCKYIDNNIPFLKIGPFKIEEVNKSPYIILFHDVMYDEEIEVFKKLARPRFKRATVNGRNGEPEKVATFRISKSAWLWEKEHKYIDNLNQRVEDMTGLAMKSVEQLQVANYGIGGHYEPHFDFARRDETNAFPHFDGNRIGTVLFYMSDVEQGGATVFTSLRTAVWPKKGTAAFWYNLHASGEPDVRTRHAACPVLVGTKWVSNKWFHERENEFRRPCELEPDNLINE